MEAPVAGLSGGNQQKIALAKWLARQCGILIVDEPTRGVDVGAKAEIHHLLDELACQGLALLVISSELPEVMNLSRRILVMRQGNMAGELARADFTQTNLMRLMAGVQEIPRAEEIPKDPNTQVPEGIVNFVRSSFACFAAMAFISSDDLEPRHLGCYEKGAGRDFNAVASWLFSFFLIAECLQKNST